MKVLKSVAEVLNTRKQWLGKSAGFVPTMGALHQGHASLIHQARKKSDVVIVSIFINPTQFNSVNDLENYPKTLESDLKLAEKSGADFVFAPDQSQEFYQDGYRYRVTENGFSNQLCGAHRPGHFDGVLSVVMKLLNIVAPTQAYFGEKDYQQLELIRGMVAAFFMPVEIVACPTVREESGLAMSSRNSRLTDEERARARKIREAISHFDLATDAKLALEQDGFRVEYLEDQGDRRFVAAWLGEVRLIDNVQITK